MPVNEPALLDLHGIGKFKIAGANDQQPRWNRKRIQTPDGKFTRLRSVRLTSPGDGMTGSHRYAGQGIGVANLKNANGTRYGTFGAGPKVLSTALTAQAGASLTQTPATLQDDAAVGSIAWGTPTNAASSNDTRTTAAVGTSHYLEGLMGASPFALPANAIVKGIELLVEKRRNQLSNSEAGTTPGTLASDSAVGTRAWTTPGNAAASDDSDTVATAAGGDEVTEYLKATNYGFTIPTTAVVLGVKVQVERATDTGSTTTSATFPGTSASGAGYGTTPWVAPSNIEADDAVRATAVGAAGNSASQYLHGSNFGFAIPSGATVLGIEATVNRSVVEGAVDSGALSGGTFASDDAVGTVAWAGAGNAGASDDAYATATAVAAAITEYLKVTNLGMAIPVGATIDGITVDIERRATQGAAPAYRATGSSDFELSSTDIHTVDPGVPATPVEGELMIALIVLKGQASTPSVTAVPSGWTLAASLSAGGDDRWSVYWHTATASEPSTYQWEGTEVGGSTWLMQAQIHALSNASASAPVVTDFEATASTSSLNKAAVTTTINNSTVFDFVDYRSAPPDLTLDGDMTADITPADGFLVQDLGSQVQAVAGLVAARVHTIDSGHSYVSFVLEVQPLVSGDVTDQTIRLVNGAGTVVGDNNADTVTAHPAADAIASYGGAADDWTASLTAADINDVDFGVVISMDLPDGATSSIDHVTITVDYTTTVTDDRVRIVTALGQVGTEDKASGSAWPTSEATATYGGAADDWGESWTPADINDIDFGIVVAAALGEGATARVDWIKLAVTYSLAGVIDSTVKLVVSGAVEGDNKAIAALWPAADAVQDYGGEADLWNTATALTPAIVNATTFGVVISAAVTDTVQAQIDHVQVTVYYSTTVIDNIVRLEKAGAVVGDNKAQPTDWSTTEAIEVYGGPNDLWGETWIDTDIENANFGAVLSATVAGGAQAEVDHMQIKVYYATAGEPAHVSKIFSEGPDSAGGVARYVYAVSGSNLHVIDPVDDSEVAIENYAATVDGGDAALWGGEWWIALRGVATDFVRRLSTPWDGVTLASVATDYAATAIEAGPDALYRAYNDFATPNNKALTQRTTEPDPADVDEVINWAPTGGEQMGDPGLGINKMATLGERLIVAKEDGVGEMDVDFTFRSYLRWMQQFRWTLNGNGLLALGQAGDFIATFRRGLWLLPANRSIGLEQLDSNDTNKRGRYTALTTDGKWVYAGLWNQDNADPTSGLGTLVAMQPRRDTRGPGIYEHHPLLEIDDAMILDTYVWPGAEVDGVFYPPRLYFSGGLATLSYFVLGETLPMEAADGVGFTDDWEVEWPEDTFDDPTTVKRPYKIEATYRAVDGTEGVRWEAHVGQDPHDGGSEGEHEHAHHWLALTADGEPTGDTGVVESGFHQRFGLRDGSEWGRAIGLKAVGEGGALTAQQRVTGDVTFKYFEQPETVAEISTTLQLDSAAGGLDSDDAYRALEQAEGTLVQADLIYGDEDGKVETATVFIPAVELSAVVTHADQPGTIFASVILNVVDFDDEYDPAHAH